MQITMTPWKPLISAVAVMVLASACGQSTMTNSVPGTGADTVEQKTWKQLTAAAVEEEKRGDKTGAEETYKAAMIEAEKLGADNPAQAEAIANLANFYYVQGAGARADELFRKSLALKEKSLGKEHVDLAVDLVGLARVSSSEKKYADASAFYQRAIAILKKAGREVPADVEADSIKVQSLASEKSKPGS
jgi:tetratricopeptide (TPR) repeat protein